MAEYTLRDCREGDLPGIAALQSEVEPEDRIDPEEYRLAWERLFGQNPARILKALVGVGAAGRIAAHEALVPFDFEKDGLRLRAGLPCKLVVAREFRKSPLFFQLESRLLREYRDAGIDFLYAPARERVLNAHRALGFRAIGPLPVYARLHRPAALLEHKVRSPALRAALRPACSLLEKVLNARFSGKPRGVEVVRTERFDASIEPLLERTRDLLGISAKRTAETLNWRFAGFPGRDYRIYLARDASGVAGYAVLRRMKMLSFEVLAIADILFPPERRDAGRALIIQAGEAARELRADLSACLLNPRSPLLPAFRRAGYLRAPEAFTLIVHEPKGAPARLDEAAFARWHLTWFDHDHV